MIWTYTLLSVIAVSAVSLIGLSTLALGMKRFERLTLLLVGLAAGAMLGNAFLHMIPEAFEHADGSLTIPLLVLGGMLVMFVVEKVLHCRHECQRPHDHEGHHHVHHVGKMSLIADGMENFIDGIAIAAAYLISIPTGLAATLAVVLHEIPTEAGDYGVLVHSGYSRKQALKLNLATALASVTGAMLTLIIGPQVENFATLVMPVAAGAFIYMAAAGLFPRLQMETSKCRSGVQLLAILTGVGAMLLLKMFE